MRGGGSRAGAALLFTVVLAGCGPSLREDNPAPPHPSTLPAPAAPLRIGTYNVHNLFNAVPDDGGSGLDGGPALDEAASTPSPAAYASHLAGLAAVLSALAANVVVLQEVEHREALDELAAALAPEREYPYRYVFAGNDPRGIDLAVLADVPVARLVRHDEDVFRVLGVDCSAGAPAAESPACWDFRYARDCLELHLQVRGQALVLLGVHLKARESADVADDAKRLAEAQHTRRLAERLLEADPALPLVILGDLNAWPGTAERRALEVGWAEEGEGPHDERPLLTSAGALLPAEDAHTTVSLTLGGPALYDDLLLSPAALDALEPGSVDVIHDAETNGVGAGASDHDPVAASLSIGSL